VFGSIVGYSAYGYALRYAPATIVGTYAYVNPVIAVLLGWLFLHEPITRRMTVAIALILAAVVWIQFSHKALSTISPSADTEPTTERRPPTAPLVRPTEAA
jgi:drug/metabolite transporter (DMT)-like permease